MIEYKRGDILKLSQVGLNHLYVDSPTRIGIAKNWRFEYRCQTRNAPDCISVGKILQGHSSRYSSYYRYHESFLERV